jgi:hypothetical protein
MKPDSYWDKIGRHMGTDYDDANDTSAFVPPLGAIACAWRLHFTAQPTLDRAFCWQQLQDFQVPAVPCAEAQATPEFDLRGPGVVVTGMEKDGDGIRVRLLNLENRPSRFRLRLPWPVAQAEVSEGMPLPKLRVADGGIAGVLPPGALRELRIQVVRND